MAGPGYIGVYAKRAFKFPIPLYWHGKNVTGLRIFSAGSTMDKQADTLDDPKTFAAWETCEALKIPVVTQLRREGLHMLYTLIRRFPT